MFGASVNTSSVGDGTSHFAARSGSSAKVVGIGADQGRVEEPEKAGVCGLENVRVEAAREAVRRLADRQHSALFGVLDAVALFAVEAPPVLLLQAASAIPPAVAATAPRNPRRSETCASGRASNRNSNPAP